MVARFVTLDRDLPRRPFASSEVRSQIRDRRPEWPPVRRVPTCPEPYDPPFTTEMGGWSRYGTVEGRWRPRTVRRTSVPVCKGPATRVVGQWHRTEISRPGRASTGQGRGAGASAAPARPRLG